MRDSQNASEVCDGEMEGKCDVKARTDQTGLGVHYFCVLTPDLKQGGEKTAAFCEMNRSVFSSVALGQN